MNDYTLLLNHDPWHAWRSVFRFSKVTLEKEALARLKAHGVTSTSPCRCASPNHKRIDEPGNGRYTVCANCHGHVCE